MVRHLHGRGTQDVLIAQQSKLANSLSIGHRRRQRIKSNRNRNAALVQSTTDDHEQSPPDEMDLNFPLPSYDDLGQAPPPEFTPITLPQTDADNHIYRESGVWRYPNSQPDLPGSASPRSIRPGLNSEDPYPMNLWEDVEDFEESSGEECLDDDMEDDESDAEASLQEMSAIHQLEEEFEREAAARGTTHIPGLVKES
jgi:hypothetical protein